MFVEISVAFLRVALVVDETWAKVVYMLCRFENILIDYDGLEQNYHYSATCDIYHCTVGGGRATAQRLGAWHCRTGGKALVERNKCVERWCSLSQRWKKTDGEVRLVDWE